MLHFSCTFGFALFQVTDCTQCVQPTPSYFHLGQSVRSDGGLYWNAHWGLILQHRAVWFSLINKDKWHKVHCILMDIMQHSAGYFRNTCTPNKSAGGTNVQCIALLCIALMHRGNEGTAVLWYCSASSDAGDAGGIGRWVGGWEDNWSLHYLPCLTCLVYGQNWTQPTWIVTLIKSYDLYPHALTDI